MKEKRKWWHGKHVFGVCLNQYEEHGRQVTELLDPYGIDDGELLYEVDPRETSQLILALRFLKKTDRRRNNY